MNKGKNTQERNVQKIPKKTTADKKTDIKPKHSVERRETQRIPE